MKQRLAILFLFVALFSAAGAGCPHLVRQPPMIMQRMLPTSPTREQVLAVVNENSQKVRSFTADKATISVSGAPRLRTNIAMTRPHNFRLQAGTVLTGPELDLGSNDQYFWFWVKRDSSKAVYYCEHDQFESSPLRHNMPISPKELIGAFGLVEFDPALPHHLSTNRGSGNIEVRTVYQTPTGPMTRLVVIHPAYGWVLEQSLYNSQDQLIMHVQATEHRRDPLTNLVMPKVVVITLPQNKMKMRVDLGNVEINLFDNPNPDLWTIPEIQGSKMVDLSGPRVGTPSPRSSSPPVLAYPNSYGEAPYTVPVVPSLDEVGAF